MTTQPMPSSLRIAQEAPLRPITEIAAAAGLLDEEVEPYGRYKAKIDLAVLDRLASKRDGKLIDVTAITPTKAGEGKTTTSLSLTQGLGKLGTGTRAGEPALVFGAYRISDNGRELHARGL